tara:strand:- start:178 stop:924 length:747 start_codon:yes stop_codon:yes gene_type:complete
MKKTILTISLFAILALNIQAQEIWMTYDIKAKKGMSEKFEQAAAKKTKMFNKTAENAIFTFQYRDGEKQGQYNRVVGYKNWDFMNKQNPNGKQQKYWKENVSQFIDSQDGWKVWERLVKVSHNWNPETTFKHMYVLRRFIKPGHDQDVYNFLQRTKMVREKYNHTGIRGVFKVLSGGNTSEFIICRGFDKFGEMGEFEGTDKNLEDLYNEMFGWNAYRKDARIYNSALEMYSRTTERLTFMENLSTKL